MLRPAGGGPPWGDLQWDPGFPSESQKKDSFKSHGSPSLGLELQEGVDVALHLYGECHWEHDQGDAVGGSAG